jgi:hypothetical protein
MDPSSDSIYRVAESLLTSSARPSHETLGALERVVRRALRPGAPPTALTQAIARAATKEPGATAGDANQVGLAVQRLIALLQNHRAELRPPRQTGRGTLRLPRWIDTLQAHCS